MSTDGFPGDGERDCVEIQSDALGQLPSDVQLVMTSGLIVGGVTALVLNAILPGDGAGVLDASGPETANLDD